jgi:hypothetical protein
VATGHFSTIESGGLDHASLPLLSLFPPLSAAGWPNRLADRLQKRPHFVLATRLHYDIIEIAVENADSKRKYQYEL